MNVPPTTEGGKVFVVMQEGMGEDDVVSIHSTYEGAEKAARAKQVELDKTWPHGRQSPITASYYLYEVEA